MDATETKQPIEATPGPPDDLFQRIGALETAGATVWSWMASANALALLRGALAAGILDAARTPRTMDDLAARTGIAPARMPDICRALAVHGILTQEGDRYALAPDFMTMTDPDALYTLEDQLGIQRVAARTLETIGAADRSYTTLAAEDLLPVARGVTFSLASSQWLELLRYWWSQPVPEAGTTLAAGGRHIEFGCGVGGILLGTAILYPQASIVGIEINAQVIAETRRRAAALGVADRVELRHMDVRDLTDEAAFDTGMWSQSFFPAETRAETLAAIFRAMKPGGYVMVGGFAAGEPPTTPEGWQEPYGRAHTLDRLIYTRWGIPPHTADEFSAELEAAGFETVRMLPFGPWAHRIIRRPFA